MSGTGLHGRKAKIIANAVNAKIISDGVVKIYVNDMLSYTTTETGIGGEVKWSGRQSMMNFDTGVFPAGFLHSVISRLTNLGVDVSFARKPAPPPLGPEIGTHDPMGFGFSEDYRYQEDTVSRLLKYKSMIAYLATGAGKSRTAILAYNTIRRTTLFLTTRSSLMYQMKDAFENCGINPGVVGDGIWEPRSGMNVGMVQTLNSALTSRSKRDKAIKFLDSVEFYIGEEAHEVGGDSYFFVSNQLRNANYRLALSGSPFMKEDEVANMRLQAVFGSVGIHVSEEDLIKKGILAKPYFKYSPSSKVKHLTFRSNYQLATALGIVENVERNTINVFEASRMKQFGLPVITLIKREKHGHILNKMMNEAGIRSAFLFGKSEQEDRKEGLRDLSAGNLDVLIGSTIFDVGVDVPSVGMVQLAGGTKEEVALRQRIGRGLRKKKTGANIAFIHDHMDTFNAHTKEHAAIRRSIISSTPGFKEGIIPLSGDFPVNLLS